MTNATDPLPPLPLPPIPPRDPAGHKGTFGTVVVIGGCAGVPQAGGTSAAPRMIGAPVLSARGALRCGAGLARLVMPAPILDSALVMLPSATGIPLPVDADGGLVAHEAVAVVDHVLAGSGAVVIGPGLGRGEGARAVVLRVIQHEEAPVIVDADAINNLAEVPEFTRDLRARAILTPHPGEFRTLCRGLGLAGDLKLDQSREGAAAQLAQRLGCIVVLKGQRTVVSDGLRTWVNTSGHPCLGTAGTGDVLSGVLASLAGQFLTPAPLAPGIRMPVNPARPLELFDIARLGVHLHGLAGEAWAAGHCAAGGLLASELADEMAGVVERFRK